MPIATYILVKGEFDMKKMLKSVFSLILSVTAVICSCVCVYGAEEKPPVEIKAKAAVLMDAGSGAVLFSQNGQGADEI